MRLMQSVMSGMNQIKKPQQKFLMDFIGLLLDPNKFEHTMPAEVFNGLSYKVRK